MMAVAILWGLIFSLQGPLPATIADSTGSVTVEQLPPAPAIDHVTSGELAGQRLTPIVNADHFWFSWAAFRPDTLIYSQ